MRRRRRVEVRFEGSAPTLERVAGLSEIHRSEGLVTCQLEGDPGPLVAALAGADIRDLLIEPARLEEAFMEYYADDVADVPVNEPGAAA
jgi:hypothetical protein